MARGLVGQGRGWLGRGAQRGGQGGLWWHVARRDILEQSRLHRSSIYYPKIIKKFLWAYITEILQVQFYYKFRPNRKFPSNTAYADVLDVGIPDEW